VDFGHHLSHVGHGEALAEGHRDHVVRRQRVFDVDSVLPRGDQGANLLYGVLSSSLSLR
jgi:hypothetical protein